MTFEAQWVELREAVLSLPRLPPSLSGLSILHLSDVHAGTFRVNELSLRKAVRWAAPRNPDLVFLTGDILGDPARAETCLSLLGELQPSLGMFAVTGNHEYGIGKGPLAHRRDPQHLWHAAGVTLLSDQCTTVRYKSRARIAVCGADYLSSGFGLLPAKPEKQAETDLRVLLIHEPPPLGSGLYGRFPLAFAGHTHGGQLRWPRGGGLAPVAGKESEYLSGVHEWGDGLIVVSRGVGTSFLPFRLLTRPEATLWRLV